MLRVGKLVATNGLQGKIIFEHTIAQADWLQKNMPIMVELIKGSLVPFFVAQVQRISTATYHIHLEDINSIEDAKKMGCFVVGLDGESDVTLSEMKVATEPIMIVVGSEGKGLSRLVREKCDLVVSIPMNATTESLNASVATSIALFWVDEARRKK